VSEDAVERSPYEADALAAADRVTGETKARRALRLAGRVVGRVLGAVILAAGLIKAVNPQGFATEIADYKIVVNPILVGLIAYGLVIVECGLGAALLVNLRSRLTLALTTLLLVVFLGAVGWAWWMGATQDCGCFGPWKRTPGQAFAEDLGLLAAAVWAWWGHRGATAATNTAKLVVVGAALAAAITIPSVAGFVRLAGVEPGAAGAVGQETFKTIEVKDLPVSLATGEHLVFLMSTSCSHCQESVPAVNALASDPRVPKLVGIAMNDRVDRGLFREDYKAEFPIGEISQTTLVSLLKDRFPRLFLVRDGRIAAVWDETMPSVDEVLAVPK
jgi:hypothetical protein